MCVYNSRNKKNQENFNIEHLKAIIDKTKSIEDKISKHEPKKNASILRNSILSLKTFFKRCILSLKTFFKGALGEG